jgi:hypothetical protein
MGQQRRAFCGRLAPPRALASWGAGLSPLGTESPIRGLFPRAAVIGSSDSDSRAARDALSFSLSLSLSLTQQHAFRRRNLTRATALQCRESHDDHDSAEPSADARRCFLHFSICACHPCAGAHANLLCTVPSLTDDPRRESAGARKC